MASSSAARLSSEQGPCFFTRFALARFFISAAAPSASALSLALGFIFAPPLAASASSAEPVKIESAAEFGYDRFAQIYRFTDSALLQPSDGTIGVGTSLRDTVDVFTELRGQAELSVRRLKGTHRFEMLGLGSMGTEMNRGYFQGVYRYRPEKSPTLWDAELELEGRAFQRNSSFQLSHDNLRAMGRLQWRRRLDPSVELGLKLRAETVAYDGHSVFEYDQSRWTVSGTAAIRRGLGFHLDLEAGGGSRSVPDSTEIAYDRAFLQSDLYWPLGIGGTFSLFTSFERRAFRDPQTRSPYWDLLAEPGLRFSLAESWQLKLQSPQEFLLYDIDGEVYQDTWLGQAGVELARRLGELEVGVQPRWTWNVSPFDTDDEFRQPSVALNADLYGGGKLWFSFSEEFGWRNYEDPPSDSIEVYTDYTFFRTTLMASYTFMEHLSLQVFVSDEPDIHQREEDDNRLTLYSLTLRSTF